MHRHIWRFNTLCSPPRPLVTQVSNRVADLTAHTWRCGFYFVFEPAILLMAVSSNLSGSLKCTPGRGNRLPFSKHSNMSKWWRSRHCRRRGLLLSGKCNRRHLVMFAPGMNIRSERLIPVALGNHWRLRNLSGRRRLVWQPQQPPAPRQRWRRTNVAMPGKPCKARRL